MARPLLHENLVKKDICYHIIAGLKMEPLENLSREKKSSKWVLDPKMAEEGRND